MTKEESKFEAHIDAFDITAVKCCMCKNAVGSADYYLEAGHTDGHTWVNVYCEECEEGLGKAAEAA